MKKTLIKLLLLMLIKPVQLFAFEVNTHQAITRCAITKTCGTTGTQNLNDFADTALLVKESYQNAEYDNYNSKYFDYARDGDGFTNYAISFDGHSYLQLIEAGVVLEDSVYPNPDHAGDGRFNNHFYAAQYDARSSCLSQLLMQTNQSLCEGYGVRTDNITWALDDSVILGNNRINDYTITDAFQYYRASFSASSEKDRAVNQAKLFVSIGFMIHMIQDLHSPAHVRNGSHPFGDYLEIYGRYDQGFNVKGSKMNPNNNADIGQAIRSMNTINYNSYEDFFVEEAKWVSNNFFSEAHNDTTGPTDPADGTGEGLDLDTSTDRDTIFDGDNINPSINDTVDVAIVGAETGLLLDADTERWFYITNTRQDNVLPSRRVSAIVEKGYLLSSERMLAVVDGNDSPRYNDYDKQPLIDTAINVIPRAVASSQGFINYFFRGKIKATYDETTGEVTIKNISNTSLISSNLLTFKQGSFDIYYIDDNDISQSLMNVPLDVDLAVNDEFIIKDVGLNLQGKTLGDKKQIIILYDGQIGEAIGADSYSLKARGLSVAYASARVANAALLFSFDKSGSMGSSIEDAKSSANSILDDIVGIDNTTTFIEIEAFSSSAGVLSAYNNDVAAAKTVINGIFSGGGTALYDAIRLAGINAVAESISNQAAKKSIVILYTDGLENSSSASRSEAINSISKAQAPEIDEVFLIFVGSDTAGSTDLKGIASQSGRQFLSVSNALGLQAAIEKILRSQ